MVSQAELRAQAEAIFTKVAEYNKKFPDIAARTTKLLENYTIADGLPDQQKEELQTVYYCHLVSRLETLLKTKSELDDTDAIRLQVKIAQRITTLGGENIQPEADKLEPVMENLMKEKVTQELAEVRACKVLNREKRQKSGCAIL